MSLNLTKGQRIDLTKGTSIKQIKVCLGWEISGEDHDLDTSAFLLNKDGKCTNDTDVIFYNQVTHPTKCITHSGDDRTGAGNITKTNDKEIITVELDKVPKHVEKINFVVTIFEAVKKHQNFGQVKNAFIRIVDAATNVEILRYDLSENYSTSTALIAGEVYRKDNDFKFAAIGEGKSGGLEELVRGYGLS
jgi:tellurium resistance protein TerD